MSREQLPLADVLIRDSTRWVALAAELAVEPDEQAQGLMCRDSVPSGTGMLFVWDQERMGGFWMFNTYIPLEIIYIGSSGQSVTVREMEPCPRAGGETDAEWSTRCGREASGYGPDSPYLTALELPRGILESEGFNTAQPGEFSVSFTKRE